MIIIDFGLSLITSLIIIFVGKYFRIHYRTQIGANGILVPAAYENEEKWLYAQAIGPRLMVRFGMASVGIFVLSLILMLIFQYNLDMLVYIGNGIGFGTLIATMIVLQKKVDEFSLESSAETEDSSILLWRETVCMMMNNRQTKILEEFIDSGDFSREKIEQYETK